MTGFALASRTLPLGVVCVELRSVNSRYLDLALKVADELRSTEAAVREAVAARLSRGKVDCRVSLQHRQADAASGLNAGMLARLSAWSAQVADAFPQARPLSVSDVLHWPGVIDAPQLDADALRRAVLEALADALEGLAATREREGGALRAVLLQRCDGVMDIVERLRPAVPAMLAALERKLVDRLQQALTPHLASGAMTRDEIGERIRQEVTLVGLRADVDEELKRLSTHIAEVRRCLEAGGAVGRRLDFLMQELNREANTLGAKAAAVESTQAAVELKMLIEQMREQIQNLE
jgi:uncharacterized protein (TIGR00255 family)